MRHFEALADAEAVARRAAGFIAERVRACVTDDGSFSLALSGGRTPQRMIAALAEEDVPWEAVAVFQVDERVAPRGNPERNLTHLEATLTSAKIVPMPVDDEDLEDAAARYAAILPDHFDLVHLGLGVDGHTASLAPGDPVLDVDDRDVALSGEYHGYRRMTLTYPALDRAREVLWVVIGEDKVAALAQLLSDDPAIPAARVRTPVQTVLADQVVTYS